VTPLLALLAIGALGATGSAWGLSRSGRQAQLGAALGVVALVLVVILALSVDASRGASAGGLSGTGVLGDRLAATRYLRLVVALWGLDAVLIVFVAWLTHGLASLRGLLPASLAAITGGTITFAATDLTLGAAAAGATGLAALVALLLASRPGSVEAAASELRVSLVGPALLIAVAAAAPVAAALVLRGFAATDTGGAAPPEPGALIGMLSLTVVLAVAVRFGAIPFHVRVPRLADASPSLVLPLTLAWIPVPLGVVALAVVDRLLAPLPLALEGERWIVIGIALLTLAAAALAAFVQDDLRHAVGYLVVADGALVLLGLASLDPSSWGPARTWLVVLAASKSAMLTWSAVVEARFETRSIPDLRGWLRRAPILGTALVVVTVATFGLPGWVAFSARGDLVRLAAGSPWDALLVVASVATLPTYLRLLGVGTGPATSKVSRAMPERIVRGWRPALLPVEHEGRQPGTGGTVGPVRAGSRGATNVDEDRGGTLVNGGVPDGLVPDGLVDANGARASTPAGRAAVVGAWVRRRSRARGPAVGGPIMAVETRVVGFGRALAAAMRRDQTELVAAAVLALAILAALTSWGALDISGAAAEAAPIVSGPSSD
jgi:NADH:ubiquinone oxidoreductase subunit 2 (subunit N)